MNDDEKVVMNLTDWNCQERFYECTVAHLREFRERFNRDGLAAAWEWWTSHAAFDDNDDPATHPIKYVTKFLDIQLQQFVLDYNDPDECIASWDLDNAD